MINYTQLIQGTIFYNEIKKDIRATHPVKPVDSGETDCLGLVGSQIWLEGAGESKRKQAGKWNGLDSFDQINEEVPKIVGIQPRS